MNTMNHKWHFHKAPQLGDLVLLNAISYLTQPSPARPFPSDSRFGWAVLQDLHAILFTCIDEIRLVKG